MRRRRRRRQGRGGGRTSSTPCVCSKIQVLFLATSRRTVRRILPGCDRRGRACTHRGRHLPRGGHQPGRQTVTCRSGARLRAGGGRRARLQRQREPLRPLAIAPPPAAVRRRAGNVRSPLRPHGNPRRDDGQAQARPRALQLLARCSSNSSWKRRAGGKGALQPHSRDARTRCRGAAGSSHRRPAAAGALAAGGDAALTQC